MLSCQECHTTMLAAIKQNQHDTCEPILPVAKEEIITKMQSVEPISIPKTFHFISNYTEKLKNAVCSAVFSQYNRKAMQEAIVSGYVMKPKFKIAPMKTSISFFNKMTAFEISPNEFDDIMARVEHLPEYFNWMENEHISRPFNQGLCGSCWAVAAATCLSDVFVVSKKTETNPKLSTTYILSCLPQGQCNGGDPSEAVKDITENGVASSECMNYDWCYNSGCGGDPTKHFEAENVNKYIPQCQCSSSQTSLAPLKKYYATNGMAICIPPKLKDFDPIEAATVQMYLSGLYGNVDSTKLDLSKKSDKSIQDLIKYHIHTYGPVIGGFHVFKNFFGGRFNETNDIYVETATYRGVPGVRYDDVERDWAGSHAVVIVGWGKDIIDNEVVDYWVVRNSWGKSWGNMGTWKMAMYGNDPNKKYQNRVSQFEYPSIVNTDQGVGLTGGVILMKAGNIETLNVEKESVVAPSPSPPLPLKVLKTHENNVSLLSFIVFLFFLIALYYIFRQKIESWKMVLETFIVVVLTGTLISITNRM
jgi:C1A family cysteine protease